MSQVIEKAEDPLVKVRIRLSQYEWCKEIAKRKDMSTSAVVRSAIEFARREQTKRENAKKSKA